MPYVFICEEDISMSLVGLQKNETTSNFDDLTYIEVVLEINKMARALSSAWAFQSMKDVSNIFEESTTYEIDIFKMSDCTSSLLPHYLKNGQKRMTV